MAERFIEYVRLVDLVPAIRNPKTHALADLEESLNEHGYAEPMLVDERTGRLVAGHGRAEALVARRTTGDTAPDGVQVGKDGEWLVPVVRGWSSRDDAHAERYLLASNRLTEKGGWDLGGLSSLLADLEQSDSLLGTGYATDDLAALLADLKAPPPLLNDPDDVPSVPAEPITKPGDLWLLGPHRVLCGDATLRESYDRVLTDLEGDQGIEEVEALWRATFGVLAEVMPGGCPYYLNGPQGGDLGLLLLLLREARLAPRHILIWVKNRPSFSIGRLDYDYQHEPIVYGWKPGGPHSWFADTPQTSVFHIDRPQASPDHPTMKPVALLVPLIVNSVPPDGLVLDPFGGSGSTLIAAHDVNRRARLIEISPHYCDVICRRFQEHTGIKPVLEATGEPQDFVVPIT